MKWTFDHSRLPAFLQVSVEGQASVDDAHALLDELLESEFWRPGLAVLVDISRMLPTGADRHVIIQALIRYFVERRYDIGKSCIATVRPSPSAYNNIRQFEYGIRLRGSEAVVRNFMSTHNAAEWLTNHAGMCGVDAQV
jgi:hypothetical protein